jgi:hypothetical protein
MGTAIGQLVDRLQAEGEPVAGSALFVCRHHVFGVGTFGVESVLAGDAVVAAAGATGDAAAVLVGTVSACHGAMNLLTLGRAPATAFDRRAVLTRARDLFNAGAYWEAHEALETVWRSIISEDEKRVSQGRFKRPQRRCIEAQQPAGVEVVGGAAEGGRPPLAGRGVRDRNLPRAVGAGPHGGGGSPATGIPSG